MWLLFCMLGYHFFQLLILDLTLAFKFPKFLGFMWLLFCQLELLVLWSGCVRNCMQNRTKVREMLNYNNPNPVWSLDMLSVPRISSFWWESGC